jgi:putative DNA primase/helicase
MQIPTSEFKSYLNSIHESTALILGIWPQDEFDIYDITLKGKENPQEGLISRSKDFFSYANSDAVSLMLFDVDANSNRPYTEQDIQALFDLLETALADAFIGNSNHATLCRFVKPSPSHTGWHIYVPVKNMSEELVKLIFQLAWLTGFQSHAITESGSILPRSIIDQAVAGPERLIFEADNISDTLPILQRECKYIPGAVLDNEIACGILRTLTLPYEDRWHTAKSELESTIEVIDARKLFAKKNAKLFGDNEKLASKVLDQRLNYVLLSSDFITYDDYSTTPVLDILLDPDTYNEKSGLRDPLDPDYGSGKCKLYCTPEGSTMHSFAHGSHTFVLKFDFTGLSKWVDSVDDITLQDDYTSKVLQSVLTRIETEKITKEVAKRLEVKPTTIIKDVVSKAKETTNKTLSIEATHDELALALFRTFGDDFKLYAGALYSFDATLWQKTSKEFLQGKVGKLFAHCNLCKTHGHYKGIVSHGMETLESHKVTTWKSQYGFPCSDGFHKVYLDGPKKGIVLEPYTKEHNARFKLGFRPDFKMRTPYWNKILANVVNPRCFQQAIGLILAGMMTPVLQSALVMKGAGGTGKGSTAVVMRAMLPKGRVTAIEIKDMSTPEVVVSLADAVVNFAPEIPPGSKQLNTEGFKSLIGCDEVRMRQLYAQSNFFVSNAAHVLSINTWPTLDSSDSSIKRRLGDFIVEFQKNYDEKILNLGDKIVEHEISGVLAWAMNGVSDYLQNGLDTEHSHEMFHSWTQSFDSIERFLSDCTVRSTTDRGCVESQSLLYQAYKKYCEDSNFHPRSKGTFFAQLDEDRTLEKIKSGVIKYKGIKLLK